MKSPKLAKKQKTKGAESDEENPPPKNHQHTLLKNSTRIKSHATKQTPITRAPDPHTTKHAHHNKSSTHQQNKAGTLSSSQTT
ncbi:MULTISPECIES: hypothetical protein, partial [Corynebacterium]|uniref:hypothetical protein n=1 Tax=Corynebacterium TaxID=1716 RepID=UPI001CEF8CE1